VKTVISKLKQMLHIL